MTEAIVVSIMIEAMRMTTLLAAPMLIGALVVGLLVSIFQAVTQIQEQTLALIPKMGAMLVVLAILFPWFLAQATSYMSSVFINIPRYIGG
jgi:flagellar biosynthetic protein FliQ